MSQTQSAPASQQPADAPVAQAERPLSPRLRLLNWSGIFFAALQSVCSAFIALSGVQVIISTGAFAASAGVLHLAERMHIDPIRIPMMLLALAGASWNLLSLWRVWSLRRRAASAWRQRAVPAAKRRSERFQLVISLLTLFLLAAEEVAHHAHLARW